MGHLQVGRQQTERRHLRSAQVAEAIERLDAVEPLEPRGRRGGLGEGVRHRLHEPTRALHRRPGARLGEQPLGAQDLRRSQRRQACGQGVQICQQAIDFTGGDLHAGHRRQVALQRHRDEPVCAARIEQSVLGQGARRHHAHHLAPQHRLAAPRLGRRRRLHLLAHRDLEASANQFGKVGLGGVDRHAGHGYRLVLVRTAMRQRDPDRRRRLHRVVEEQLVEVAHPEEDQGVGLCRLGLEILRHHRRRGLGRQVGEEGEGA